MAARHLGTYLNNHLAGSVVAIELLDHLASVYKGTETEGFATELRAEVLADRNELEELMTRLEIKQNTSRKASAWLGEKFAQLKLLLDDPKAGSFWLLEVTEALSLGIEGKKSLWMTLSTISTISAELCAVDYARLIQRAGQQREKVEALRLSSAKASFISNP